MDTINMVGQFLLSLSLIVVLHECGHFFPARWFKTRVERFYLFFHPWFSLVKIKRGETEYGIGWLPLGGYVKISGMIDESFDKDQMTGPPQPWEFRSKPAWQRLIIMIGGVTVNFILAVVVFAGILMYWGEQYLPNDRAIHGIVAEDLGKSLGLETGDRIISINDVPLDRFDPGEVTRRIVIDEARIISVLRDGTTQRIRVPEEVARSLATFDNKDAALFTIRLPVTIAQVAEGMTAEEIGLRDGDQIVAIGDTPTGYYDVYQQVKDRYSNQMAPLTILRSGDTLTYEAKFDSLGRIGFMPYGPDYYYRLEDNRYSLGPAIVGGYKRASGFIGDQLKAFGQMFRGKIKASESLGSFISIGQMYGPSWNWRRFWSMTA
ncbi:MAG: site-2 protease family protein, partial [Bacteroidota bacterium]